MNWIDALLESNLDDGGRQTCIQNVISELAERLQLDYEPWMQDWPCEATSEARIEEFLRAYETEPFTDVERFILMDILIECFSDVTDDAQLLDSDPRWLKVLTVLETNSTLFHNLIDIWSVPGLDFPVQPSLERLARKIGIEP